MKRFLTCSLLVAVLAARAMGQGTILWDESVDGPLSQSFDSPTPLPAFQFGTNSITGTVEVEPISGGWFSYPNFFTISVPSNAIVSTVYLQINKPNIWIGIKDPGYFNGLAFAGNPSAGALLPQWGLNDISAGQYGMYLDNHDQQTLISIANYRLDFFVQTIPEPGTFWLLLGGFVCLGLARLKPALVCPGGTRRE